MLDEALVVVRAVEDVELHLHGAPVVVRAVRRSLGEARTEHEPPPSLEGRAYAALARVRGEWAARILLDQAEGALRRELERILERSGVERRAGLELLDARGKASRVLLEPPRVVLAGPTNAGKSTLFNLLVGEDRALVDETAGTTRDVVREFAHVGPLVVELLDTAGEREVPARVEAAVLERAGQLRGRRAREHADLTLWLHPAGAALAPELAARAADPGFALLRTRADEAPGARGAISARANPKAALQAVEALLLARLAPPVPAWVAGRAVPFDGATRDAVAVALRRLKEDPHADLAELARLLEPAPHR